MLNRRYFPDEKVKHLRYAYSEYGNFLDRKQSVELKKYALKFSVLAEFFLRVGVKF